MGIRSSATVRVMADKRVCQQAQEIRGWRGELVAREERLREGREKR